MGKMSSKNKNKIKNAANKQGVSVKSLRGVIEMSKKQRMKSKRPKARRK